MFRITPEGTDPLTTGTVSNLKGISFPETADKGWAAGQAIILMYENGNWTSLPSLPAGTYTDIFFLDDQTGWVCGSVLGKTLNGTTWQKCPSYPALQGDLIKLFFLDASNGWGVGFAGQILQTSDGGNTWSFVAVGLTSEILINVQFTSLTNGYICGNDKILLKYGLVNGEEEYGSLESGGIEGVEVWPNPTHGKFQITSAIRQLADQTNYKTQIQNIEVIDPYGNIIVFADCNLVFGASLEFGINNFEVDLSYLPAGIYFIRISFENQTITKKLIIQK
jgi:hypothetical protein